MNFKEIKKLISIFEDSKILSELEVEESGFRVRLKKSGHETEVIQTIPSAQSSPAKPLHTAVGKTEEAHEAGMEGLIKFESPIVGTFYQAPGSNKSPFVNEGDIVKKGQILCIIEAMKIMNEIEVDRKGRIIKVFVEDGTPVEFGQPLFLIEPL
tara:strand:+ start:6014 stop:6475 length:462 start_codon:yes stop_codon:yes gene_type:complete